MAKQKNPSLHESISIASPERAHLAQQFKPRVVHGGPRSIGKRKTERPWNPEAPVHLFLQSSRAKGAWSLTHRRHRSKIQAMIYRYAERFGVRIYRSANLGRQIELLVKAKERKHLADFLRVLAGQVAVRVTGATKGKKKIGRFWDYLTFSKLINWGREFFQVSQQIQQQTHQQLSGSNPQATRDLDQTELSFSFHLPLPST